ncbi:MAG: efflux transporter periplasmic adaptor subunit [Candidatus Marinimicrobia bacterium]|nr:efflux transporter periplasmic adaptor subunit [Candidatus Neomarinimicrobiota bacterium]|tara:strand:- start:32418 stop:33575 length:1158 start_codon:yes stop_codon:yes gene_type:complete
MKNKKFFGPTIVITSSILLTIMLIAIRPEATPVQRQYVPPLVETLVVEPQNVQVTVKSQGEVIPRTEINLTSEISGRVLWTSEKLSEGATFSQGDTLLRLDPRDYELTLIAAESNLSQSRVALSRERAESELAKTEWERLGGGEASELALRKPQLAQARAQLAASEAAYEQASRNLSRSVIFAPFAGRVRRKNTDIGAVVAPGSPLATIYAIDYVEVRLPIANKDLAFLNISLDGNLIPAVQQPEVVLSTNLGGKYYSWKGTIVRSEAEIDPRTRMLSVVARVPNPYAFSQEGIPLKVGLYVNAAIKGKKLRDVVILPRHVVHDQNLVWVKNKEGILTKREISIIRVDENKAFIGKGLNFGNEILISRLGVIVDGMQVRTNVGNN